MTQEERMDFIEFRLDLLREGTEFAKYLYDCKITREQLDSLYAIMDLVAEKVNKGERVSSTEYESKVLSIVDKDTLDYHFCELFAKLLWEEQRYEDVFPALYGDSPKYKHLFK